MLLKMLMKSCTYVAENVDKKIVGQKA